MGGIFVPFFEQTFESIKHVNENGQEFWYARELQIALDYSQWRRFNKTIERAKVACEKSGNDIEEHFAEVGKTIEMPKNAQKEIQDYELSRYACYLIVTTFKRLSNDFRLSTFDFQTTFKRLSNDFRFFFFFFFFLIFRYIFLTETGH